MSVMRKTKRRKENDGQWKCLKSSHAFLFKFRYRINMLEKHSKKNDSILSSHKTLARKQINVWCLVLLIII